MDNPTIYELLDLILLSEAAIDTQSQFWITVTFATIVATYAARKSLSGKLKKLVTMLYLIATVVFASRWYYEVMDILAYQNLLLELGYVNKTPFVTLFSRVILMASGTVATIYFIHFGKDQNHGQ